MPMRTAIFGGSFNPIHRGHIALADFVVQGGWTDEVWLLVSPQNPLKAAAGLLPEQLRLALAQQATENYDRIKVSDFEFNLPRPSFTYKTLAALRESHPDRSFQILIGADNWSCFNRWARHEELLRDYELLVYPREGYDIHTASLPPNVRFVPAPLFPFSSTQLREMLLRGEDLSDILPQEINKTANISLLRELLRK